MRSPSAESEGEMFAVGVANFLACAAVVALVAGALFFLVDLHVRLSAGASAVSPLTPILFLIGVVAIQRLRARGNEIPYWPVYVVGLAFAMLYNLSRTTGGAPSDAKFVLYAGIAVLWLVADRLARVSTMDFSDVDSSAAGILSDEPALPGERVREIRILKHPGALVLLFSFVTLAIFLVGERYVTGGSLGETAWYAKFSLVGALALLAIAAMFAHLRYCLRSRIERSRGFLPVWLLSAGVLIAGAMLLASLIPRTDLALRKETLTLARKAYRVVAPVTGGPSSSEPGKRSGEAPNDSERAKSEKPHPSGQVSEEGARRSGSGQGGNAGGRGQGQSPRETPQIPALLASLFRFLRYLAWLAVLLGVLYVLLRFGRRILGEVSSLGGIRGKIAAALERLLARILGIGASLRKLFAARPSRGVPQGTPFHNPFLIREILEDRPVDEAVRYAYEEMRRIADDLPPRGRSDLTPYEFLRELPEPLRPFAREVAALTELYVLAAYSARALEEKLRKELVPIWDRLIMFAETTAPSGDAGDT
ncbi:MAG: DUF4129 domain-containing protein [Planctomycetota bacterium]